MPAAVAVLTVGLRVSQHRQSDGEAVPQDVHEQTAVCLDGKPVSGAGSVAAVGVA